MNKTGLTDKVNFICKNLSITDDPDFSCTVEFSDALGNENENIDYIINNTEKYLLIQRSYLEDIDEIDWYTVETSDSETELNQKDKIIIKHKRNFFEINWLGSKLIIGLELSDSEYNNLNKILKKCRPRSQAHFQFTPANSQSKNCKRVCLCQRLQTDEKEHRTHNT